MNHPNHNEWLLGLDGEASPEDAKRLHEHLTHCPMCAAEFAGWQRTAQKLRHFSFPGASAPPSDWRRETFWISAPIKWGLAAALVLFIGLGLGRRSVLRSGTLPPAIAQQLRDQVRAALREDLVAALNPGQRAKDYFQKQLRLDLENAFAARPANVRMYTEVMATVQRQREQDQRQWVSVINNLRDQHISDYLALRQDLETAVATADNDLRQNSRRINQLADTLITVQK